MSDFAIKAISGLPLVTSGHSNDRNPVASERQTRAEGGKVLPPTTAKQTATVEANDQNKDFSDLFVIRTTELRFQPSEIATRALITVRDTASGEVVRQIPSKALVAIAAYIEQYLAEVSRDSAVESLIDDVE